MLLPASWTALGRGQGIHDDSGYLGLDEQQRPFLYGSDGGLFRPTTPAATAWERAGTGATGLNSFQITDVSGTTVGSNTSIYYATQDNGIWASPDGGTTWPTADCAEGFFIQVRNQAAANADVTVAYGKIGCGPSGSMFSDANLVNQRAVPDVDMAGAAVSNLAQAFLVEPGKWVRWRTPPRGRRRDLGLDRRRPALATTRDGGPGQRGRLPVVRAARGETGLRAVPRVPDGSRWSKPLWPHPLGRPVRRRDAEPDRQRRDLPPLERQPGSPGDRIRLACRVRRRSAGPGPHPRAGCHQRGR